MYDPMAELLPLIRMENYLTSFIIHKRRTSRNKLLINLNPPRLFMGLVPNKNTNFSNLIKSFTQIMLIDLLPFSLVKVTFQWLLLHLSNVHPTWKIFIVRSLSENIILQNLFMFVFDENSVKGLTFFYATFFIINYLFFCVLDHPLRLKRRDRIEDLFVVLAIRVRRRVDVV